MHFSCWLPAIAVNYSTSVFKLIHFFFILDEAVFNDPKSLYVDKAPHSIPRLLNVDEAPHSIPRPLNFDKAPHSIPRPLNVDEAPHNIPRRLNVDWASHNLPEYLHVNETFYNMTAFMSVDKAPNNMPKSLRVDETTHNMPGSLHIDKTTHNIPGSLHIDKTTQNIPGPLYIDKTTHSIPGSLHMEKTINSVSGSLQMDKATSLYVDKTLHNIAGSAYGDKVPHNIPESVHDYSLGGINTNSKIAIISDRPHSNHPKTEQLTLSFKIISRRVHLKTLMSGKLSWNGQTNRDGNQPLIIIQENSAVKGLPFVMSDVIRRARPKWSNFVDVYASCLVHGKSLLELPIIVVSLVKMPEEQRLAKDASSFVSTEDTPSSLSASSVNEDTSLGYVGQRELEDSYQGSGRATGRKLQLVVLNAVWAEWTPWSACSSVCGKPGFTVRKRHCNTAPNVPCDGMNFDMRECIPGLKCEAKFSDWGGWGPCSTTCGKGIRARSRVCVTDDQGLKCSGMSSLLERCRMPKCDHRKPAEEIPAPPPTPAASSDLVPAYLKGKRLVAQKFYMFPARLVKRIDLISTMSPGQAFRWGYQGPAEVVKQSGYQEPVDVGERGLLRAENFLNIKIPVPPMRPEPRYESRRTSPVNPYIWGAWGEWSVCSEKCGDGKRMRTRFCLDHSQEFDVRVKLKWCGKRGISQTLHCLGPCSPVNAVEEEDKVKIIESADSGGPRVKYRHTFEQEMNIDRAQVVETGSRRGPNVEYSKDNDKSRPLTRVEVEETGGKGGPVVRTEHEPEEKHSATEDFKANEELRLTAETYLFIVLFVVCVALITIAFCIFCLHRTIDANKRKQMRVTSPFYKPDVGADEDEEEVPLGGVIKTVYKSAPASQRTAKSASRRRKMKARRKQLNASQRSGTGEYRLTTSDPSI